MWWLWSSALAQIPPNVDVDDLDKWESAAEVILDLPEGCWEWVGQASWDWDVGRFGGSRGDAAFAGRTEDGVWGEVALEPLGELRRERRGSEARVYDDEARFTPLVGRLLGARVQVAGDEDAVAMDENVEAVNVLRDALARIGGDAFTSYAEWDVDRGGVVLHRAIPLAVGRREEIQVDIFFPGGAEAPSMLDVTFPATFKAGGRFPRWTVRDAEVHIRGLVRGTTVFPTSEAFKFGFGFFGFRFDGAQTIVYKRVSRCEDDPVPAPVPAPEPEPAPDPAPAPDVADG